MAKESCFVTEIDLSLSEKLKEALIEQGFALSVPEYTVFSAKKKGLSCTLFKSGKLTVQGKQTREFVTLFLEPEILHDFSYSYPELKTNMTPHIGIDEAGKGDFFGPLCVAAFYGDEEIIKSLLKMGVMDSKRISDKNIKLLAQKLQKFPHTLIRIFPEKYNYLYDKFRNLNHLLAWGHVKALEGLRKKTNCNEVLIDKFANENLIIEILKQKQIHIGLTQKTKAEEDPVVAAASIIARNSFLEGLDQLTTQVNLKLPKGAGSEVIRIGKQIFRRHGTEIFKQIAKVHFKSYLEITDMDMSV